MRSIFFAGMMGLALATVGVRAQQSDGGSAAGGSSVTNVFFGDTATVTNDDEDGTNKFSVVGSALTGIPQSGVTGLPDAVARINTNVPAHLNLDRLYRWRNTIMHSNRPVRIYLTTDQDSDGAQFPSRFVSYLANYLGYEGGQFQGGGEAGRIAVALTNAPLETVDPPLFIGTTLAPYRLTNNSTLNLSRVPEPAAGRSNVLANTGHIIYLTQPLGGTFTIQTNIGAGWGTYAVVDDFAAGATNLVSTNLTLADGYYQIRVLGTTGTNRVYGGGLWHSTNKVISFTSTLLNSGPSVTNWLGSKDGILPQWFAIMNPDLMLIQDTGPDAVEIDAAWEEMEALWTNASPQADVVMFGQFHFTTGTDTDAINSVLRTHAKEFGRGYFDMDFFVPDNRTATNWVNLGMLGSDGIHLTSLGGVFYGDRLWNALVGESLLQQARTSGRNFNGELGRWLNGGFGAITATSLVNTGAVTVIGSAAGVEMYKRDNPAAGLFEWFAYGPTLFLRDSQSSVTNLLSVSGAGGAEVVITASPNFSSRTLGSVAAPFNVVGVDVTVADEAYGAGWNGSTEVPTKNALYDKIETIAGGSGDGFWETNSAAANSIKTTNNISIEGTFSAATGVFTNMVGNAAGLTNLTLNIPTNVVGNGIIPVLRTTYTNIAANIVIGGFSGVDLNYNQWAKLYVTNEDSSPHSVTFSAAVATVTNSFVLGKAVWVTNGLPVTISIDIAAWRSNAAAVKETP
jgi:hypothetical protein